MEPRTADSPELVAVDIVSEADLVSVRQVLRREADRAGLGLVDATKLITAGSELARNILTHAGGSGGRLRIADHSQTCHCRDEYYLVFFHYSI